jgi:hypothetical protein
MPSQEGIWGKVLRHHSIALLFPSWEGIHTSRIDFVSRSESP